MWIYFTPLCYNSSLFFLHICLFTTRASLTVQYRQEELCTVLTTPSLEQTSTWWISKNLLSWTYKGTVCGMMVNRPVILIPLSSANGILERSLACPFQTQPEVVATFMQTNFPTWLNNLVHPLGCVWYCIGSVKCVEHLRELKRRSVTAGSEQVSSLGYRARALPVT